MGYEICQLRRYSPMTVSCSYFRTVGSSDSLDILTLCHPIGRHQGIFSLSGILLVGSGVGPAAIRLMASVPDADHFMYRHRFVIEVDKRV